MTDITRKLDEIEAGLEGVTPGPWLSGTSGFFQRHVLAPGGVNTYTGPVWGAIATCELLNEADGEGRAWRAAGKPAINAAHIARCDPDTMRELVRLARIGAETEARRAALDEMVKLSQEMKL
jgi:hypothetical protein